MKGIQVQTDEVEGFFDSIFPATPHNAIFLSSDSQLQTPLVNMSCCHADLTSPA